MKSKGVFSRVRGEWGWRVGLVVGVVGVGLVGAVGLMSWWRSPAPEEVEIGNVGSYSLSVAWQTERPVRGAVVVSEEASRWRRGWEFFRCRIRPWGCRIYWDEIGGKTHFVYLRDLEPEKAYYYRIVSGNRLWKRSKEGKILPAIRTAKELEEVPVPQPVFGYVFQRGGERPVVGGLVWLELVGEEGVRSAPLLSYTNRQGVWLVDLSGLRSLDGEKRVRIEEGDQLFIKVWDGEGGEAEKEVEVLAKKKLETIVMGEEK